MAVKKIKDKLIMLLIILIVTAALISGEILVNRFNNKVNSPEIIGIDGVAYIQKGDYTCKLLDAQGRQIAYNDYIWADHEFKTSKFETDYIFRDLNTGMVYILVDNEFNNIPSVNIMYNNSWLEENEELNLDKDTVTIEN